MTERDEPTAEEIRKAIAGCVERTLPAYHIARIALRAAEAKAQAERVRSLAVEARDLCEDGHPVSAHNLAAMILRALDADTPRPASPSPAVEAMAEALERIEETSNHYASMSIFSEVTLRYAHESTKRLARAALAAYRKEMGDAR